MMCSQCGRLRPASKFTMTQVNKKHMMCDDCMHTPSNKQWRTPATFSPHCQVVDRVVQPKPKKDKPVKPIKETAKKQLDALFTPKEATAQGGAVSHPNSAYAAASPPRFILDGVNRTILDTMAGHEPATLTLKEPLSPAALAASKLKYNVDQVMLTAYPVVGKGYVYPWSDAVVATTARVPESFVAAIRKRDYGSVIEVDRDAATTDLRAVVTEMKLEISRHHSVVSYLMDKANAALSVICKADN